MLTKIDIQTLIDECRIVAESGLGNGTKATIKELELDFLTPPTDFLGIDNNPAIFINLYTFRLLGKLHEKWLVNKTIAVKENFLENKPITVIGIIVHEVGHAFNVAANIPNSEANAYIFEIEVLSRWFKIKHPLIQHLPYEELHLFFISRLGYYHMETKNNPYLKQLVLEIESHIAFAIQKKASVPIENSKGHLPRVIVSTPKIQNKNPLLFFKRSLLLNIEMPFQEGLAYAGGEEVSAD